MSAPKAPKARCRECDEYNPHTWIPGQRRVTCDACGYKSHWIQGTYHADLRLVVVNNGFMADWQDGEYDVDPWSELLKDGQNVRLSLCCYCPNRSDLRKRKVNG